MPKICNIFECIKMLNRCDFTEAKSSIWVWFCYISSDMERDKWIPTEKNSEHIGRATALILPLLISFFLIADCRQFPASLG